MASLTTVSGTALPRLSLPTFSITSAATDELEHHLVLDQGYAETLDRQEVAGSSVISACVLEFASSSSPWYPRNTMWQWQKYNPSFSTFLLNLIVVHHAPEEGVAKSCYSYPPFLFFSVPWHKLQFFGTCVLQTRDLRLVF